MYACMSGAFAGSAILRNSRRTRVKSCKQPAGRFGRVGTCITASKSDCRTSAQAGVAVVAFDHRFASGLFAFLFFDHGLRGGKARNRHPEGRSADVVHADTMAEFHAFRVATMLTADADFQLGPRLSPALDGPFDQHSDPGNVEGLER